MTIALGLRRGLPRLALLALAVSVGGCESLALTAFGVGTSAGLSHTLNGYAYRTFTAPEARIKVATLATLQRMSFKVAGSRKTKGGQVIQAKAENREIEVELEALSPTTTRMRAVARDGLMNDSATAQEIIAQTERTLGHS